VKTVKFDDKREEHLANITLTKSRIKLDQPILFLCGGQVDITLPAPVSVRGALVAHLHAVGCELAEHITLAEDFKDWIHDSVYKDLLIFESDIAHISSLIVIILESAGALTELGLFVRNKSLRNKILVFISDHHYKENSFIKLGPLRHLEDIKDSSVCAYPWEIREDNKLDTNGSIKSTIKFIREDILSTVAKQDKSEAFDIENEGHLSFVIYELILTFRALKLAEIEQYLTKIGISIKRDKLKRLLFLLSKFNLASIETRGHEKFYFALSEVEKVNFGGKFDKTNAKLSAMQYYGTTDTESKRLSVIQSVYKPKASTNAIEQPDSGAA
jgi:hypothetical protein